MRASQIQQQLKFNAEALTEMYKRYGELRGERKTFNEKSDACNNLMMIADGKLDFDASHGYLKMADEFSEQAAIFTPHIQRLRKRIASMEQIQKALKHELKNVATLEAITQEIDAEWLQRAAIAREDGFVWSGTGQEFLEHMENK